MLVKSKHALLILATAFSAISCKKDTDTAKPVASDEDNSEDPEEDPTGTISLSLTPTQTFDYIDQGVATAMSAALTDEKPTGTLISTGSLAISLLDEGEVNPADPTCNTNGTPWDSTTNQSMQKDHLDYVGASFYCAINSNTYSPESVQGAYFLSKMIVCAMNEEGIEFSADAEPASFTFRKDSSCLPEVARDRIFEDSDTIPLTITAKLAPEGEAWTHYIDIDFPATSLRLGDDEGGDTNPNIRIAMYSGKDFLALRTHEVNADGTVLPGGYALSMDLSKGIVRFDGTFARIKRHIRLLAKGQLDPDTGAFKSVDALTGLDTTDHYDLLTINGTRTDGFVGNYFKMPSTGTAADIVVLANYTTPTKESCASLTGSCAATALKPAAEADIEYIKVTDAFATQQTKLGAYKDLEPLKFEAVSFDLLPQ